MVDKETNFKRIAERRTNEILAKINSFKHFRNKAYYKYTQEQLNKIRTAIESELDTIMSALEKELN